MSINDLIPFLEKENFDYNKIYNCYQKSIRKGILTITFYYGVEYNKLQIQPSSYNSDYEFKDYYIETNIDEFLETYNTLKS